MEQQQEIYGIPYTMAVHDIERLEETTWLDAPSTPGYIGVNEQLKKGWVLLAIKQSGNEEGYDALYVLGVPRPQFCTTSFDEPHPKRVLKEWNHQRGEWECRWCIEEEAHRGNERFNNPTQPW